MKPLCLASDLISAFGEEEIKILSSRMRDAEIDYDVVNKAIAKASAEIHLYLTGRKLQLAGNVPAGLIMIACDIARYYLHKNPRLDSSVGEQYKMRIKQLQDIASGKISFGLDDAGQAVEPESTVMYSEGQNIFRRQKGGIW